MALLKDDPVYYKDKILKLICQAKDNDVNVKFDGVSIKFSRFIGGARLPRVLVKAKVDLKKECGRI